MHTYTFKAYKHQSFEWMPYKHPIVMKKNARTPFEVLILIPLPSVVENTHPHSMLLTLGLGIWHALGKRLEDISRYLKSAYTVKPALLYLCHCNDNMFWPVSGSMKNEIHMQSRADPDEPNIQLSNHSRVTKPSLN